MARLHNQFINICNRNRDGSHSTQANRYRTLQMFADQLKNEGFDIKSMNASDLKGRHVNALVRSWRDANVTEATMKNRMAVIRWWAEKVNNAGAVKDNATYGIGRREYVSNADKSLTLENGNFSNVSQNIMTSLKLQEAFGLRREESMKFQPSYALQGQSVEDVMEIQIKGSWAKGGRERAIPITNDKQRRALHDAFMVAGGGSLIPIERSYREHLRIYERETFNAGVGKTHGLRHNYAQNRYKELTGYDCPAKGGTVRPENDEAARLQISQELGHNRIAITSIYLGGRLKK